MQAEDYPHELSMVFNLLELGLRHGFFACTRLKLTG